MVGGSGLGCGHRRGAGGGRGRRAPGLAAAGLRGRGADHHRRRRPGGPRHRVRHGGDADLSPPPAGAGRPGAHHVRRPRRAEPPPSRHRALAPDRDRRHAGHGLREARPSTCGSTSRRCGRRSTASRSPCKGETLQANTLMGPLKVDERRARPHPRGRPRPGPAAGGRRAGRRDADVDGRPAGDRRADRARRSPPPPRPPADPGPGSASGCRWR